MMEHASNDHSLPTFSLSGDDTLLRLANVAFYLAAKLPKRQQEVASELRQRVYALYTLMLDDTICRSATGLESASHQVRAFSELLETLTDDPARAEDCHLAADIVDQFERQIAARRRALFSFD